MRNPFRLIAVSIVFCLALSLPAWAADKTPEMIVNEAAQVLKEMAASDKDKGFPVDLLRGAAGVVIVPSMLKIGVVLGGSYGQGVILAKNAAGQWRGPAFLEVSAGSIGLQLGVQKSDVLLVIKTRRGVESLLTSQAKLGGDLAAVAGPMGAQVGAETDTMLKAEIYTYARSKGLFLGVSLQGAQVNVLPSFNEKYTGVASAPAILAGEGKIPASGKALLKTLKDIID